MRVSHLTFPEVEGEVYTYFTSHGENLCVQWDGQEIVQEFPREKLVVRLLTLEEVGAILRRLDALLMLNSHIRPSDITRAFELLYELHPELRMNSPAGV